MVYCLEEHFRNPKYSHLDHYTKRVYIEYIKELSKLCKSKEYDGNFPEYLLISKEKIEQKINSILWKWERKLTFDAWYAFLETVDIDFYNYV